MTEKQNLSQFGHHLIIGIAEPTLTDYDKRLLSKFKPAGVLLLGRNFLHGRHYSEWLEKFGRLVDDIYQYSERTNMFITLDHEGGLVHRAPQPITRFPHAALYRERSEQVARAAAQEVRSLGVNVSWAPVTDIHSNPNNPIIGRRAFGETAEEATEYALAYYNGLSQEGILGSGKHFPGHGDTSTDSHFELPVVNLTMKELQARELLPFEALCKAGVPFLMTAHIMYPKIDPKFPATMSPTILNDIIRKQFGYDGLVVSDDLDMKAVSESFSKEDTLASAFNAGCDMFILARQPNPANDRSELLANYFFESMKSGLLTESTVNESRRRIDTILTKAVRYDTEELPIDVFLRHQELALEIAFGK